MKIYKIKLNKKKNNSYNLHNGHSKPNTMKVERFRIV